MAAMNSSSVIDDQALIVKGDEDDHSQRTVLERRQVMMINYFKHFSKSSEILKQSFRIIASNSKLMFFMIVSIVPLFVFMVFFDLKLQKTIAATAIYQKRYQVWGDRFRKFVIYSAVYSNGTTSYHSSADEIDESRRIQESSELCAGVVELCVLYLIVYPLVELFSVTVASNLAAKVHAGEKQVGIQEVVYPRNSLKGVLVTFMSVHLLSSLNLLGLFWVMVVSCKMSNFYDFRSLEKYLVILVIGLYVMIFVALLYKYIDWSASWNMGIAISVLEEEFTGLEALGMTEYYGKHSKRTGFQLMLCFVAFCSVLRLSCLYFGGFYGWGDLDGVLVTCGVVGLVCLGNLVKWVAFVFYFYDCKQQTMEKKNDQELGKTVNV